MGHVASWHLVHRGRHIGHRGVGEPEWSRLGVRSKLNQRILNVRSATEHSAHASAVTLYERSGLGAPHLREQSRPALADKPHPEGARNAEGGNHADQSYSYSRLRDACLPRLTGLAWS